MRFLYALLAIYILLGCKPLQSELEPVTPRKQLFDENWQFSLGDFPEAAASDFDAGSWRKLDLPHDWSIEGTIHPDHPMGNDGGYFPAGIGWYRKTFEVPADWSKKVVSVYFEGVYMNAEVFVNGVSLGTHPYGYTSFTHDISQYLNPGETNLIAIRVDNSQQKNCRWYSGSGIYRHVWLEVTEPIHVAKWGVAITSTEVSEASAKVQIETRVSNKTQNMEELRLETILIYDGQKVGELNSVMTIDAGEDETSRHELIISDPKLWQPDQPHLYQAAISIIDKSGKVLDRFTETFGVRSIEFSAENGFLLNGKSVLLNGGCVHHDNGCLGAKAYNRAEERKVELLKKAGFNAVRTSHNPPSEAFLEACDRLGLLVIDEAFDGWRAQKNPFDYASIFDEWATRDVQSMVLRDRNHPSIIFWSIGNEIIERTSPEAIKTAIMLRNAVREMDTTRPVTSAMTTWGQGWDVFDSLFAVHDVGGYNYQLHMAESDHERVPERVIMQTESYPRDAFFCWNLVQSKPYIIGDFVWTAMDYLGESGIGRYYYPGEPDGQHWEKNFFPWHGAYCGDIDLTGWRKPISHYRSMLYNDDEKLYLAVREPSPAAGAIKETMWSVWPTWESWNWDGFEGKSIDVEVYSKYPVVRLYLNDELIGEKPTTISEEFKAVFSVIYKVGELKAVGLENGKEVAIKSLKTAQKADVISLKADRETMIADGQDLCYVSVELVDASGVINPQSDQMLNFQLEGPGQIIGVDNGDLKDPSPYVAHQRKTWNGRALVVIKSDKSDGEIILKVSSENLPEASLKIKVIQP